MVRSGLTIEAKAGAPRYRPGELALVTLRVSSTRVGHAFPTYVTPRVVLSAELVDDTVGRLIPPGDAAAFARALDQVLAQQYDPKQLRARVLPVTWERVGPRLAELTRALLS